WAPPPDCEGYLHAKSGPQRGRFARLLAQTQLLDQGVVALHVLALEIIKQRTALVDHGQQAAARMVVLVVLLEVLGQVADPLGKDRDLHFRRTGIARCTSVVRNDFLLL